MYPKLKCVKAMNFFFGNIVSRSLVVFLYNNNIMIAYTLWYLYLMVTHNTCVGKLVFLKKKLYLWLLSILSNSFGRSNNRNVNSIFFPIVYVYIRIVFVHFTSSKVLGFRTRTASEKEEKWQYCISVQCIMRYPWYFY